MSKCPYTNFKDKVMKYINFIRTPRKEYGDLPPCPFVGAEIDKGKLMIDGKEVSKEKFNEHYVDRGKGAKFDNTYNYDGSRLSEDKTRIIGGF